jgi:cell fate regulator YaaT (PSP1 superfamily)
MKMAKLQKATLDPAKLSGRCGRLKCCLRYEYDTYEEHRRELPSVGTTVVTKQGQGRVLSQELLSRQLLVSYDDGRRVLTNSSDIVTVVSKGNRASNGQPDSEPGQNQ